MSSTTELFFIFGAYRVDNGTNCAVSYVMDQTVYGYFVDPLTSLYSANDKPKLLDVLRKPKTEVKN